MAKDFTPGGLAKARRRRLQKESNNWVLAIVLDLLWGVLPWVAGTAVATAVLFAIHENDADAQTIFPRLNAPVAIGTISTFSAFLLVSKIQANLTCNSRIIGEFGNLTGSLINLAIWVRSQRLTGYNLNTITPLSGFGQQYETYATNRLALVLASIPYIVKYNGRHVAVVPEWLPMGQDPKGTLVDVFKRLTCKGNGTERMSDFAAAILMVSEQLDQLLAAKGTKDAEYAAVFAQLNAATAAEGTIGATAGYVAPYLLDAMNYIVFVLFMLLLVISDVIPTNDGNAIWIAPLVALCTAAFFQISDRYWNAMALRSKRCGQPPLVSKMCVATEVTIVDMFERHKHISTRLSGGYVAPDERNREPCPQATASRFRFSLP